ncbi:hypothetical protein ACIA49_25110 [Kribbella sp. NPDC051587]|uniref:hypothetical protein n=1 Tax=Kribbella sp. NPDC051587 TaxID=3364119 RepID=UPI0037AF6B45
MEFAIFVVIFVVVSIIGAIKKQSTAKGQPSPRVQQLIERIQAQQGGGNQPVQFQGQFTQPTGQPQGQLAGSQQAGAALQALMQAGRQHAHPGERMTPGQPALPQQYQPAPYQPGPYQPPATWQPAIPQHNYQQRGPQPKPNLDARVRELMKSGNEVTAVRVLSDEMDLGLLEAQQYARNLVTPATPAKQAPAAQVVEDETRYVGSAAIAESMFAVDRDEDTWASGWVDTPEPDDRSDIDELWETVRNPPRPTGAQ